MKTYNRLILNRIPPVLDPLLRNSQNGFRPKRSTVGQILALRRILEGVKEKNMSCIITFIDFKKAFDTVHRGKLIEIIRAYGVPEKVVMAILASYTKTWAKVVTPDGTTDLFEIMAGVMQGDTLAPFLFVVVLDYALSCVINGREEEPGFTLARRRSRRMPAVVITDLDYADDISLLSDTVEQARTLLAAVELQCCRVGLELNSKKTKVMAFNSEDSIINARDGTTLEVVEEFKYLGAFIGSTESEIRVRRTLAWKALHGMRRVWRAGLSDDIKRRLFVATVESVLLYGAETWTLTANQERALDGVYTRIRLYTASMHGVYGTRCPMGRPYAHRPALQHPTQSICQDQGAEDEAGWPLCPPSRVSFEPSCTVGTHRWN